MKNYRKIKGYSLLETTLTLSVVAVLMLIGSSFRINNGRHQLEVAVRKIYSNLSLARFRSIQRQLPIRVSFNENFCELAEYDSQQSLWITRNRELLEGVKITANNFPVFYPQGTVSNLATIKVLNANGTYQITVAITGRIKASKLD
ncbi:MAG: GspH/FimT family pseudopilin [Candidatus Saccharicenans sp.]